MTPLKLIVVEDEVIIAENMRQSLNDLGYEVVNVSNNFEEARYAIEHEVFDLAIMDINLEDNQGRTGLDLATELKKIKDVPFIFITAYSDLDTITNASKLRPSAYLVKPVNDKTMFSTIQVAFQNYNENEAANKPEDKVSETDYFFTKIGSKNYKVLWKDVYLIKAVKNYVEIKSFEYTGTFLIRTSLSNCLESLVPAQIKPNFIRINRSEAIHSGIINSYDNQLIYTAFGDMKISADIYSVLVKRTKS